MEADLDYQWVPTTNTYCVTNVGVTVSGYSTIRLPNDADATLTGHEDGHDRLMKDEYDKNAKTKVEDAFRGFKGACFVGQGATDDERFQDAQKQAEQERDKRIDRATAAIAQQMEALNRKYDKLTDHGKSKTVNTAAGEAEAKKERDKAVEDGRAIASKSAGCPIASTRS